MSSPIPWNDARDLLNAASLTLSDGSVFSADRFAWPNEAFVKPDPPAVWAFIEMIGDDLSPIEIGTDATWLEEGRLYVHILSPAGTGTDDARWLGKQITKIFRALGPRPVVYNRASIGAGQLDDTDGAWWRLTVTVDYQFQDQQ